jgi:hypothetical protein
MKEVTLTACDKDSSAGTVEIVRFENKDQFIQAFKDFESKVSFSRWYLEIEAEDLDTEKEVESWVEELETSAK